MRIDADGQLPISTDSVIKESQAVLGIQKNEKSNNDDLHIGGSFSDMFPD